MATFKPGDRVRIVRMRHSLHSNGYDYSRLNGIETVVIRYIQTPVLDHALRPRLGTYQVSTPHPVSGKSLCVPPENLEPIQRIDDFAEEEQKETKHDDEFIHALMGCGLLAFFVGCFVFGAYMT